MLHWNPRSWRKNKAELINYLRLNHVHVICLQETWKTSKTSIKVPGYTLAASTEHQTPSGGVAILVSNSLPFVATTPPAISEPGEIVTVELCTAPQRVTVASYYNPRPRVDTMLEACAAFSKLAQPCYITGDFNAHHSLWGCSSSSGVGKALVDWLNEDGRLTVMNDGAPTHYQASNGSVSAIDLCIVSNSLSQRATWKPLSSTLSSDHYPCIVQVGGATCATQSNQQPKFNYKKADWGKYKEYCREHINADLIGDDVTDTQQNFVTVLLEAANASIPMSNPAKKGLPPVPWWTLECAAAIKARNAALNRARRTKTAADCIEFKRLRAVCKRTLENAQTSTFRKMCEGFNKDTPLGTAYRMAKGMTGKSQARRAFPLVINGNTISEPAEVAEQLAQHLADSYPNDRTATRQVHYADNDPDEIVYNAYITGEEILQAIRRTPVRAPGPDGVSALLLKNLPLECIWILTEIFNMSWESGIVPEVWKQATLCPIKKPNKDPSKPESYRLIALTSIVGKVLERIINARLNHYLESNNLFAKTQYGFRAGLSTAHPLAHLEEDVRYTLNKRGIMIAVCLDMKMAYDLVSHNTLITKLQLHGIEGRCLNWIKSHIDHRSVRVKVQDSYSNPRVLTRGVAQGSPLSCTLFNICVNDLHKEAVPGATLVQFADDTHVRAVVTGKNTGWMLSKAHHIVYFILELIC